MRAANPAADNHLSKTPCPVQAQALPCSRHPALAKETPHAPSFQITGTASRNVTNTWMTSFGVNYPSIVNSQEKPRNQWVRLRQHYRRKTGPHHLGLSEGRLCGLWSRASPRIFFAAPAPQAHGTPETKPNRAGARFVFRQRRTALPPAGRRQPGAMRAGGGHSRTARPKQTLCARWRRRVSSVKRSLRRKRLMGRMSVATPMIEP